jgi:lysophospholipase L1-like esterase
MPSGRNLLLFGPLAVGAATAIVFALPQPVFFLLATQPPVVAFVGDSYTGGSDMGGYDEKGWPQIVSASLDWTPVLFAIGGSGFVSGGSGNETFLQRIPRVVTAQPNVVIVEGGGNDLSQGHSINEIVDGATAVLQQLHAGLPTARLILVSPVVPGNPSAAALNLRDRMIQVAQNADAAFIDPIADQWLSGPQAQYISSDGVHPTDEGHAAIARLAEPRLRALEIPRI